jgi:hypothetical protein
MRIAITTKDKQGTPHVLIEADFKDAEAVRLRSDFQSFQIRHSPLTETYACVQQVDRVAVPKHITVLFKEVVGLL